MHTLLCCHPVDKSYCIPEYTDWSQIGVDLIKSCPDLAQYQVMRLVDYNKRKFVRILNLSDIKSVIMEEFEDILSKMVSNQHSLFADIRG